MQQSKKWRECFTSVPLNPVPDVKTSQVYTGFWLVLPKVSTFLLCCLSPQISHQSPFLPPSTFFLSLIPAPLSLCLLYFTFLEIALIIQLLRWEDAISQFGDYLTWLHFHFSVLFSPPIYFSQTKNLVLCCWMCNQICVTMWMCKL